jgi:hypothetical protein
MLGGPVIQEHVVEFLLGSGVKTDGVLDGASPNGPWSWVVPMGVAQIFATGCGAGSGGNGGTSAANSGGGGGGGSGMYFVEFPIDVVQNTSLQITIGAKGIGGTPTVAATAGGDTTIEGVVTPIMTDTGSTLKFLGGGAGITASDSNGIRGNDGGKIVPGTTGGTSASTPTAGTSLSLLDIGGYGLIMTSGAGGGAASSTGSTAGANGGGQSSTITNFRTYFWTTVSEASGNLPTGGTGNTTGTVSRGGGGIGGSSLFGEGGNGGNGGANGTNATGYGAGGGGGGGTANGGDGSDGYLRITYWSAD